MLQLMVWFMRGSGLRPDTLADQVSPPPCHARCTALNPRDRPKASEVVRTLAELEVAVRQASKNRASAGMSDLALDFWGTKLRHVPSSQEGVDEEPQDAAAGGVLPHAAASAEAGAGGASAAGSTRRVGGGHRGAGVGAGAARGQQAGAMEGAAIGSGSPPRGSRMVGGEGASDGEVPEEGVAAPASALAALREGAQRDVGVGAQFLLLAEQAFATAPGKEGVGGTSVRTIQAISLSSSLR